MHYYFAAAYLNVPIRRFAPAVGHIFSHTMSAHSITNKITLMIIAVFLDILCPPYKFSSILICSVVIGLLYSGICMPPDYLLFSGHDCIVCSASSLSPYTSMRESTSAPSLRDIASRPSHRFGIL